MADPVIQQPSITLSKTIGGFYRVVLHGPDNLQSQSDRPRFCEMDIASSWDKDAALKQAADWFDGLEGGAPEDSRRDLFNELKEGLEEIRGRDEEQNHG